MIKYAVMRAWVWAVCWVVWVCAAGGVWGGEVVPELIIDGTRYEGVRWGPVNKGQVVILHDRGSAVVDLNKLPEPYRSRLAARHALERGDSAAARVAQKQWDQAKAEEQQRRREAEAERARWAVLGGVLLPKSELVELVGFVRSRAEARVRGEVVLRGTVVELAERRNPKQEIPAHMVMRPGLWKGTGERVFLKDYVFSGEVGELVRVWGREMAEPVAEMRAFEVAREPTAAEWVGR